MKTRLLMTAAVLAIAAAPIAGSAHQTQGNDPADTQVKCGANVTPVSVTGMGSPVVSDPVPLYGVAYIDVRSVAGFAPEPVGHDGQYIWSIWVYIESNGHEGLQTKAGTPSDIDSTNIEGCSTSGHAGMRPDFLVY